MPRLIALILVFVLSLQARAVSSYALEKCDRGLSLNSHEFPAVYSLLVVECEHGWDVFVIDGRVRVGEPLGYVDGMSMYGGYFAQMLGLDPSGKFRRGSPLDNIRRSRDRGIIQPTPIGDVVDGFDSAVNGISMIGGLPISILSGDIFVSPNETGFTGDGCEFLISVSGIWNDLNSRRQLRRELLRSSRYRNIQPENASYVQNATTYLGDLIQIIGDEIGLINITSIRTARQIEAAAEKAEENGCCDYIINLVGHSQGTSVIYRALHLIDDDIKSHIIFRGYGGQRFIPKDGLRDAFNYPNWGDFVPYVNYLPYRWTRFFQDTDVQWDNSPSPIPYIPFDHSWNPHYVNRF